MLRLSTLGRLGVDPGPGVTDGGPRPRRLALLAILAASGPRGASRDRILGILWPESEGDRGRHALSQTLYSLRRDLASDVVVGGAELKLDSARIRSDLDEFREAIARGDWEAAAACYAGPFCHGFFLSEGGGFEEWVEDERRQIASEAGHILESAAIAAERAGDLRRALQHWTRLGTMEPLSGRHALRVMQSLAALGDRAGALAHARVHTDLVRRELQSEPDQAVRDLASALRVGVREAEPPAGIHLESAPSHDARPDEPPRVSLPHSVRWRFLQLAMLALLVTGGAWFLAARPRLPSRPVIAVGTIRDLATADTVSLGGVIGEMLSTALARLTDLDVIASTRILQLIPPGSEALSAARATAAREAGATEVLEGEISPDGKRFRLDLRRMDLATGRLRRGYVVTADDRFALMDSATAAVALDLAMAPPATSLVAMTTRSPIAYRLYEEGLRAYYQVDQFAAARLFRNALDEDSTFALAAYYAWRATPAGSRGRDSLGLRALRLSARAPERERLLMRAMIPGNDPMLLAAAESLAIRYPADPEACVRSAEVFIGAGEPLPRAVALLERAIALDSSAAQAPHRGLRLADAFRALRQAYALADSTARVGETVERWSRLQPGALEPWYLRGAFEDALGNAVVADQAYARHAALSPTPTDLVIESVVKGIHRGNRAMILDACTDAWPFAADLPAWSLERWYCALGYRHLGQYTEALHLIRSARPPVRMGPADPGRDRINEILLDFEMARPGLAARAWRELAAERPEAPWSGFQAKQATWLLTLSAMSYVAAQDTVAARSLVDSIAATGARSLYARDPRLHFFVRGLLFAYQGRHEEALVAYREAAFSWPLGFTRVNLEFARSALALGRPRDAIYPLQAALRGGLEGPQLHVTRTELRDMLARAFDASGLSDSAAAHYRYVARMWSEGDGRWKSRGDSAAQWLVAHRQAR